MFKSEAKLFLSANNNINSAKTLINECKRLIVDFDLEGNSDCKNLKSNINNCNINALVNKVEDTKESLMKLDQGFASEYMTLLQEFLQTSTIDTSNMTDEEKMQYDIKMDAYGRDYNQTLLYMLEKYEESGMLTDEMKQQLQYQRETMAQYDIKDKMAVLDPTTDEYINLFKQCADCDRKLINLNTSLSEEEKASYLKEYNTQYNQNLGALINARDTRLKREKDEKELEELYASKADNNGFWHPFVESEIDEAILDKKIAMKIASEDEIAYKNMNNWDRFLADTGTFAASTFTGLYNITEGIGDSFVMLGSAVNIVEKDWASDYISRDLSGELYQGIQLSNNMNTYSAYGTWHTAGEAFGEFVGKTGITFAAPWASAALYGLDAMGQSAETSFNNGDDYWKAFAKSTVSGIGGAVEGFGMSKLNLGVRKFMSSGTIKTLSGTALTKIKSLPTTISNVGSLKTIMANGMKKTVKTLGTSFVSTVLEPDAMIETGSVIFDNAIDGDDWKKTVKEAGAVFIINWGMNFATELAFGTNNGKPATQPEVNEKLTLDDLSYKKTGPLSSSYYMLESNVHKYSYVNTNTIDGLNDSIKQNGLYHFTSESACDKILDSGYVKKSGYIASYGNKKSFFFNGVPEVGAYATNIDDLPLRTTAVKIMPDSTLLNSDALKIRNLDDMAITHDGDLTFSSGQASKEYFCLFKENDKLVYRNVTKEFYDSYPTTESGKLLEDFVSKKSNISTIKNDFYYNLSTNASGAKEIGASFGTALNNNVIATSKVIDNPAFGASLDVNYEIELQRKFNEYNQIFDNASPDVKYAITEANKGHAISFRSQVDVDTYTKLSALQKEIYNLQEGMENVKKISKEISENSKLEADKVYRENLQKNIPGYDDYYAKQQVMRNKSNLDRASEILDEWGRQNGYDNYAETALRKYAETGSAYQIINGKQSPYITSKDGVRSYIESLNPEDISAYLNNKHHYSTLSSSNIEDLNDFFKNSGSSLEYNYGVNQGGIKSLCEYTLDGKKYSYKEVKDIVNDAKNNGLDIPKFQKEGTKEYFELKDKLISKGFTNSQASVILSSIDDIGACSYAAKANSIFYKFSKNPELFEECFGFPMYKINVKGEKILNSNELLLDMYLHANDMRNGGSLFLKNGNSNSYIFNTNDKIDVFGRKMLNTDNQVYMSTSAGSNNQSLNSYLGSKGLDWDSYVLVENSANNVLSYDDFNSYIYCINTSIEEGKAVQLNLFSDGNDIRMLNSNKQLECTTKTWDEGSGHAVFVTGMNNEGFLVSSWGAEYLIPFSDLQNGGMFTIMIDDINVTGYKTFDKNSFAVNMDDKYVVNSQVTNNTKNISPNSKLEADKLYRENLQKNIPGYDDYYAKQQVMRNKSNLDRASEILDEWGRQNGYDNYAETALRKYAETGSAYQIINGKQSPYITSKDGVRSYIESLNPEDISAYLNDKTFDQSSFVVDMDDKYVVNSQVTDNTKNISPNSKLEADKLYRENLQKNIPGYDDYYAKQQVMRNKSNLDRASEILDEWGRQNGYDNYAETALRKYAETGSTYQIINGKQSPYITSKDGVRSYIESLNPEDISEYLHNKTLSSSSVENLDSFFKNNSSRYIDNFGVNQSGIENLCTYTLNGKNYSYKQARNIVNAAKKNGEVIPVFEVTATKEWLSLRDKLISKGFTQSQATVILQNVDDIGACSYAAKANSIFYKFSNNPQLFEEKFGFPMYIVNDYGQKVLNSNELLLDMYVFANDIYNGGNLFTKFDNSYKFYTDDRIDIFGNKLLDTKRQAYMCDYNGSNEVLKDYLNSKGLELDSYNMVQNVANNKISNDEFSGLVGAVEEAIRTGKAVQMNVFSNGHGIRLIKSDGTMDIHMKTHIKSDGTSMNWGHAVFVTGIQKDGFLVSSYGRQNLIPFEDLIEGGKFNIMIDDIM